MVRADPGQFRPVVNRQGRGWHWLSACDIPSVILSLVHALHPLVGNIRLFGLLLRLVRAGDCRVGHDPAAHGCLAALRALDSRGRLSSEKGHFRELGIPRYGSPITNMVHKALPQPPRSGLFGTEQNRSLPTTYTVYTVRRPVRRTRGPDRALGC
jgi:hypothetical protein